MKQTDSSKWDGIAGLIIKMGKNQLREEQIIKSLLVLNKRRKII